MEQLVKALAVLVLDFQDRAYLDANDPQALKQALEALKAAGFKCPDGYKYGERAFWTVQSLGVTV